MSEVNPHPPDPAEPPRGVLLRRLKGRAQLLEPVLKVGKAGVSAEFLAALDEALAQHELVKVRFEHFKDRRKELAVEMAARTGSHLIQQVGHVAVLFRARRDVPGESAA